MVLELPTGLLEDPLLQHIALLATFYVSAMLQQQRDDLSMTMHLFYYVAMKMTAIYPRLFLF